MLVRRLALALVLSLTLLSGCLPAVGQMTTVYEAPVSAVLETVVQLGPQIRPGGDFTPLRLEARSRSSVVLRASETMGSQVVSALAQSEAMTVRVSVTALPVTGASSQVTVSALPEGNAAALRAAEALIMRLERRFGRVSY